MAKSSPQNRPIVVKDKFILFDCAAYLGDGDLSSKLYYYYKAACGHSIAIFKFDLDAF